LAPASNGHYSGVDPSSQGAPKTTPDPDTATFDLPNDDTAPSQARRAVRKTFTRWRLSAFLDDALLTVSELVTNAVRHGLPPISLLLRRRAGQVRMDVDDGRPEPLTAIKKPSSLDESGRGLGIVREVTDNFGSEHIPGDGKSVHASWNTPARELQDGEQ
jgi:anti-sigma regulatory factor (Ser/Thr protein kinase)